MGSVNLVVTVESARTLITHNSDEDTNALHVPSLIAVAAALGEHSLAIAAPTVRCRSHQAQGVKFLLFLYCFGYRKASSQVRMLWEDHRNDLFINGFGDCPAQTRVCQVCSQTPHSRPAHVCRWEQTPMVSVPLSPRARLPFARLTLTNPLPAFHCMPADLDPMGAIIVRV